MTTWALLIYVWAGPSLAVTHIAGFRSWQACQAALTQVVAPAPLRAAAVCIAGPERSTVF